MNSKPKSYAVLVLAAFLFFIPVLWPDEFYLNLIISTYLQIILAVSLNMIIKTGKLSIAHAAFMGVGDIPPPSWSCGWDSRTFWP